VGEALPHLSRGKGLPASKAHCKSRINPFRRQKLKSTLKRGNLVTSPAHAGNQGENMMENCRSKEWASPGGGGPGEGSPVPEEEPTRGRGKKPLSKVLWKREKDKNP